MRQYLFIHFLPHTTNAVSITETNHLMLQPHGNSAGRSFFSCLADKRRPNALPDTASVPSYVKPRGILTVDDGSKTNDRSDNNI